MIQEKAIILDIAKVATSGESSLADIHYTLSRNYTPSYTLSRKKKKI